jgi:hypothetical protein
MIEGDSGFSLGQLWWLVAVEIQQSIYKEQLMNHTFSGAAAVAALALTGLSAHAGCTDPRAPAQQGAFQKMSPIVLQRLATANRTEHENAVENIVGTWHVIYTAGGSAFGEAFIQWHNDGTEWENINFPILGGNICMGSWKPVDKNHVTRNHIGWLYTNGTLTGYFTETETDEVARDGNSYHGTNDQKVFDLEGNMVVEVPGTSTATRIAP